MSTHLSTRMSTQTKTQSGFLKGIRLYSPKEYAGLSNEQKEKHREHVLRNILLNAKEGVTVPQIVDLLPHLGTKKTIQKYLDKLVNINFGYNKLIGNTLVYFPNGRLLHEVLEENVPIGKKVYSFIYMKNPDGEFIAVQEKKKNELDALILSGGIIIDKDSFPNFLEHIQSINKRINKGGD